MMTLTPFDNKKTSEMEEMETKFTTLSMKNQHKLDSKTFFGPRKVRMMGRELLC